MVYFGDQYCWHFDCKQIRATGGLLKYLEKMRIGVELEDASVRVPVMDLKVFTLYVVYRRGSGYSFVSIATIMSHLAMTQYIGKLWTMTNKGNWKIKIVNGKKSEWQFTFFIYITLFVKKDMRFKSNQELNIFTDELKGHWLV